VLKKRKGYAFLVIDFSFLTGTSVISIERAIGEYEKIEIIFF